MGDGGGGVGMCHPARDRGTTRKGGARGGARGGTIDAGQCEQQHAAAATPARQHRCVPDRARRRKWKEERAFGWWGLGTHGRMVRVLAESTRARSLSLSSGHQFQPRPGRREGTQRIAAREKEGAAGGRRGRVRARRRFSVGMCLRSARVCLRGGLLEGRTALLRSRASFSCCWILYHATPYHN